MSIWRVLSDAEEEDFKEWPRKNFKPGDIINPTWHPIVQQECQEINMESGGCRLCASKKVHSESENGFCDSCNFWFKKISVPLEKRTDIVIIDGYFYTIPEYEGVLGERNEIKFFNGDVIFVNKLNWYGKIPERFVGMLSDNAKFGGV